MADQTIVFWDKYWPGTFKDQPIILQDLRDKMQEEGISHGSVSVQRKLSPERIEVTIANVSKDSVLDHWEICARLGIPGTQPKS